MRRSIPHGPTSPPTSCIVTLILSLKPYTAREQQACCAHLLAFENCGETVLQIAREHVNAAY